MKSLSEIYSNQTGLNSCYMRRYRAKGREKQELVFTRKYVWWLETMIKDASNCIIDTSISNPLEAVENTYKILYGENVETSPKKKT